MGRHIQFADLDLEAFREMARLHVAALNHALANVAARSGRGCTCAGATTRGRITTTSRSPTSSTSRSPPGHRRVVRGLQSTSRARVAGVRDHEGARRQGDHPRRARLDHQLHRASRTWWPSGSAATRGSAGGRTSSPGPTAADFGDADDTGAMGQCNRESRLRNPGVGERGRDNLERKRTRVPSDAVVERPGRRRQHRGVLHP